MSFEKVVETIIREAQESGRFTNLPGRGKPVDLTEYFNTPEEVRVAQMLLKNAGMVPVEIELIQEIAALKESLANEMEMSRMDSLRQKIEARQLELNLLLERNHRGSR